MEKGAVGADLSRNIQSIYLHKLEEEQKKLAKTALLKDAIDFGLADSIAGCDTLFLGNRIIAAIVILNKEMEIIEQQYTLRKAEFPYIAGFRAYRELPAMIECYSKLQEQFDVMFVEGHGIAHPRKCGIATHFGIAIQKPTIGIAKNILVGEIKDSRIWMGKEVVGIELQTKEGSRPVYVTPGNLISLNTAVELTKRFTIKPHKLPQPLVAARKYANRVRDELNR